MVTCIECVYESEMLLTSNSLIVHRLYEEVNFFSINRPKKRCERKKEGKWIFFFHKSGLNAHNNNETAIHNWQFKMLITSVVNSNVYNYKAYEHLRNIFGGQKQSRHIYRKTEQ